MAIVPLVLALIQASPAGAGLDTFGILRFHPTKAGTVEWNSAHWGNGISRRIQYDGDPYDPTGWTDNHSSGSGDSLYVDGHGLLEINGSGPRFHINSIEEYSGSDPTPRIPPQFFLNTEATGYFQRRTTGGSAWDGMEIQARTDPLAHASAGGDVCNATGLASRFRDDGKWDWEKELKHPASTVYSTAYGVDAPLFPQGTIPLSRWIGMKFLVYDTAGGTRVHLETWIDTISDVTNGPPAGGGHWERVGAMVDSGTNWPGADISGCPTLTPDMAVTTGHGTLLLRTDNETAIWKDVSVREIVVDGATTTLRRDGTPLPGLRWTGDRVLLSEPSDRDLPVRVLDPAGRIVFLGRIRAGQVHFRPDLPHPGLYLLEVGSQRLSVTRVN